MILVDTSVWVNHLRQANERLGWLLDHQRVLMHPYVLGELACSHLPSRKETLRFLARLPSAPAATHEEALELIETHGVAGRGIGYGDVHILAGTLLATDASLWTLDQRLGKVAESLGVAAVSSA